MSIAFLRTRLSLYVTCTRALIHSPSRVDDKRLTQDESLTRDTVTASSQAPERRTKAFILDAAGTKTNTQAASSGSGHSCAADFDTYECTRADMPTAHSIAIAAPSISSKRTHIITSKPHCNCLSFTPCLLKEIVGSFGLFLRADDRTLTLTHPIHARMCIEVDVSKPLPTRVWIRSSKEEEVGFWQKIVYEGNISYCYHCCLLGHDFSECRKAHPQLASKNAAPKVGGNSNPNVHNKQGLITNKQSSSQHKHPPKQLEGKKTWKKKSKNRDKGPRKHSQS